MSPKIFIRPECPQHVINAKPYDWRAQDGGRSPGVGIFAGTGYGAYKLLQYLDAGQALALADQLVDAAETISNPNN